MLPPTPYQPPEIAPHVPPTMLAYSSARGTQPIPLDPQYVHLLNQAGEYYAGARLLKISGISDFIWGIPLILAGLLLTVIAAAHIGPTPIPPWVGAAVITLGALMFASGIWLVFFPTPGAMIVDGITLILLGALNGVWFAFDITRGRHASKIWIALSVICVLSGIARFRRYKRFALASTIVPPRETLKWLDELRKSLRRIKPQQDSTRSTFAFQSTGTWPPVICKGRMMPQVLMCLVNSEKVQFYRKSEFRIEPLVSAGQEFIAPADSHKKVKANITLGDRTFNAYIPYESLARLHDWQTPANAPTTPGIMY